MPWSLHFVLVRATQRLSSLEAKNEICFAKDHNYLKKSNMNGHTAHPIRVARKRKIVLNTASLTLVATSATEIIIKILQL